MKIGLRDYFAGLAMQGELASRPFQDAENDWEDLDGLAHYSYAIADAMMKERQPKYPPLESLGFNTRIRNSLAAENIYSVQGMTRVGFFEVYNEKN